MAEFIGQIIIYVIVTGIPLLLGALGIRVNNQRQELKKTEDIAAAETRLNAKITKLNQDLAASERDRAGLQAKLDSQTVILNDLRQQSQELGHFKVLYDTLLESHNMLKADHQQLKADFGDIKIAHENERRERAKLAETYNELYDKYSDVVSERDRLAMQLSVHQSQWLLLGDWIKELVQSHPKYKPETDNARMDSRKPDSDHSSRDDLVVSHLHPEPESSGDDSVGQRGGGDPGTDAG